MEESEITLEFDAGTLVLDFPGAPPPDCAVPFLQYDSRVMKWRARACDYAPLVRVLYGAGRKIDDRAKNYKTLELKLHNGFPPMRHQSESLEAWKKNHGRGVVVMPTGSGKSYLAVLAMLSVQRSTLVVVPTIDLLQQWTSSLEKFLKIPVGMLGGGSKDIRDVTVSTYDSAVIFMEHIGANFGLAIYDECHHLPGPVNRLSASMCLAPYRLALSATPDRGDEGDAVLLDIVGPKVHEIFIDELEGRVLAPYVTEQISVELTPEEAEEYAAERKIYTDFIRANRIDFSRRDGWSQFIIQCARQPGGRRALNAYLRQRTISRCSTAKWNVLWMILQDHPGERTIIFTADNDTAYHLGNRLCLPVITHKTKAAERKAFLDRFRSGEYTAIVTSKVLNEGVDVPEASVGVVISGSGSTREHVQRLGRILRASRGKQAVLYELISENTAEIYVSERRRQSRAYDRDFKPEDANAD